MPRHKAVLGLMILVVLGGPAGGPAGGWAGGWALAGPPKGSGLSARAAVLARSLDDIEEQDPQSAQQTIQKIVDADGDEGLKALQSSWRTLSSADLRNQILRAFAAARPDPFGGNARDRLHPALIDVLDLGARDPNAAVQSSALRLLKPIALVDFAEDYSGYQPWYDKQKGLDANEVLIASAEAFVSQAADKRGDDVRKLADFLDENGSLLNELGAARSAALNAGFGTILRTWLTSDDITMLAAMRLTGRIKLSELDLRELVLPLAAPPNPLPLRAWAIATLGDADAAWALDDLLALLESSRSKPEELRGILSPMARALGRIGEARAIPALIAAMEAEGSAAGAQTVGAFGLSPLTGVRQGEGRDAKWWRGWWEKNRSRYGKETAQLRVAVPKQPEVTQPDAESKADADVADVPAVNFAAEYDNQKRYTLIGLRKDEPSTPYKVLVVLPGGDGQAGSRDFLRRVYKNSLSPEWVLVQVIAPRWDAAQADEVVWPTRLTPYAGAAFNTETLLEAVLADLKGRTKIDPQQVYLMAWSSGGPAAYTMMMGEQTPFKGALIAMSVMQRAKPSDWAKTKDRRFWLYQSPDDNVTPMKHAEDSAAMLKRNGARVELATYPGGHGWQGEVYPAIKSALDWLTKPDPPHPTQAPAASSPPPAKK